MLREKRTFFIDRSLGSVVVASALEKALIPGEKVIAHDQRFNQDVADDVWLQYAGRYGWIALSKDDAIIRKNPPALVAILTHRVRIFVLTRQDMKGDHMAELFVSTLPKMRKLIEKYSGPFIVQIGHTGDLTGPLTEKRIIQILWEKHRLRF